MKKGALAVFFGFLALYLYSMPPALAPYRDAGEMTVSAGTLGVSHPTGYPLYILAGNLSEKLPLGNPAYRLTLFSVLAGVLALSSAYLLVLPRWGALAAFGAVLLLGLNRTFWSVSLVPEMYSLGILGAVLLFWMAHSLSDSYQERKWLAFACLYGLLLCNRMDILLLAPGLFWIALARLGGPGTGYPPRELNACGLWACLALGAFPALVVGMSANWPFLILILGTVLWLYRGARLRRWAALSAGFAFLGLILYLYLPIRSMTLPWLDWNHPADPLHFKESLLRTRYGGTLDLISLNYAKGELFGVNMRLYARHLWENFSLLGLFAAGTGFLLCARRDFRRWLGMTAAFAWCGPIFLLMANMPANPHAASIVEPHYLLSDLIMALWAAEGMGALAGFTRDGAPGAPSLRFGRPAALAAVVLMAAVPLLGQGRWEKCRRRGHMFSYDYAKNVLRSVPPGGVLVAKKDVQLYTLWHYQTLHRWRPDVRVVAQGLSGSPWYKAGWLRRDRTLWLGPLRDDAQWRDFTSANKSVYATLDADHPASSAKTLRGLVFGLGVADKDKALGELWPLMARRGDYRYEEQPDFFTTDLIMQYGEAESNAGNALQRAGRTTEAAHKLISAWSQHWVSPNPVVMLGYLAFTAGRLDEASTYYSASVRLFDRAMEMAEEYNSLEDIKAGIRKGRAEARMHLGVTAERKGDPGLARRQYQESLKDNPTAQTYYNLGVLDWKEDPGSAAMDFAAALKLDPGHADARKYLQILRRRDSGR